jgi:hypothetical protein
MRKGVGQIAGRERSTDWCSRVRTNRSRPEGAPNTATCKVHSTCPDGRGADTGAATVLTLVPVPAVRTGARSGAFLDRETASQPFTWRSGVSPDAQGMKSLRCSLDGVVA